MKDNGKESVKNRQQMENNKEPTIEELSKTLTWVAQECVFLTQRYTTLEVMAICSSILLVCGGHYNYDFSESPSMSAHDQCLKEIFSQSTDRITAERIQSKDKGN